MSVYLLYQGEFSERILLGVYDSLEVAQIAADGIWASRSHQVPHQHVWERNDGSLVEPRWQCSELITWRQEWHGEPFRSGDNLDIEQRLIERAGRIAAADRLGRAIG